MLNTISIIPFKKQSIELVLEEIEESTVVQVTEDFAVLEYLGKERIIPFHGTHEIIFVCEELWVVSKEAEYVTLDRYNQPKFFEGEVEWCTDEGGHLYLDTRGYTEFEGIPISLDFNDRSSKLNRVWG